MFTTSIYTILAGLPSGCTALAFPQLLCTRCHHWLLCEDPLEPDFSATSNSAPAQLHVSDLGDIAGAQKTAHSDTGLAFQLSADLAFSILTPQAAVLTEGLIVFHELLSSGRVSLLQGASSPLAEGPPCRVKQEAAPRNFRWW